MSKSVHSTILVAVIAGSLSLGCGEDTTQQSTPIESSDGLFTPEIGTHGGSITISESSDPKSFNYMIAQETSSTDILKYSFEGLTGTHGVTTEVIPLLAESWSVADDKATWTFHLRKNVQWFDGMPFTADDVDFTFNRLVFNPQITSSYKDGLMIEGKEISVEKIDDYTVRMVTPVPFAPFLSQIGVPIMPKHALESAVESGKFNETWGINTPPKDILGTGPFKITEYLAAQKIVLRRNEDYWRKDASGNSLPYLDQISIVVVPNQEVELLKFQAGELDAVSVRGQDYPILKPKEREQNFTVLNDGPAFGTSFVAFNQNPGRNGQGKDIVDKKKLGWFTDVAFRRAVAHALDKETIINNVMNGLGYPQISAMSPAAVTFYNSDVPTYDYDLDKARQILADAGYLDQDGDGVVEDKSGNTVEFDLITNAGNSTRENIGLIVQADLKKIGIKVNFAPIDFNALVTRLTKTYDWEGLLMGLTGGVEPEGGRNVWVTKGSLHFWNPQQESPATAWEAEIDSLFNVGVQELDPEKRKLIYDRFQHIVAEQLPVIYSALPAYVTAVRNTIGNARPTAYARGFHDMAEVYRKDL
ncbi:MAG: ABC transporter substrate-binding protein [Candidatus Latescibacteria bacterium]|nr:ABC transporter substrate-binding protein [Candidatus Latescibacterota bacterium]